MTDAPPRILIVEDEPPLAELERIALEGGDYHVEEVGRGELGLEIIEREPVDLVLLDYKLPDTDGFEFIVALGDRIKTLPVIVITGYADAKLARKLLNAGAADYVIKDTELVFLQKLPKAVGDTLERFRLRDENQALKQELEQAKEKIRELLEEIGDG